MLEIFQCHFITLRKREKFIMYVKHICNTSLATPPTPFHAQTTPVKVIETLATLVTQVLCSCFSHSRNMGTFHRSLMWYVTFLRLLHKQTYRSIFLVSEGQQLLLASRAHYLSPWFLDFVSAHLWIHSYTCYFILGVFLLSLHEWKCKFYHVYIILSSNPSKWLTYKWY